MMGIGLVRLSFSPLAAALIGAGELTPLAATRIGAVLLSAYFLGALVADRMARRFGPSIVIRAALGLACAALLTEVFSHSAWIMGVTRLLANASGACLIVLGPTMVVRGLPAAERPKAMAVVFMGVGLGSVLSGWTVALVAPFGPVWASVGIAVLASACVGLGWGGGWPSAPVRQSPSPAARPAPDAGGAGGSVMRTRGLMALHVIWILDAIGNIPCTVYLSDFVASELDRGVQAGALAWSVFGLGCLFGPLVAAWLFRVAGMRLSLATCCAIKGGLVVLLALGPPSFLLLPMAFGVGLFVPGAGVLVTSTLASLVVPAHLSRLWGYLTAAYALSQGAGGMVASVGYDALSSYAALYAAAGGLLVVGTLFALKLPGRGHCPPEE